MKNFTWIACCGISNTELTLSKSSMEYVWEKEIYLGNCIQLIFEQIIIRSIRHKRYRCRSGALVIDDSEPVSWNSSVRIHKKNVTSILKSEYFQGIHWDKLFYWKTLFLNTWHRMYLKYLSTCTKSFQRCCVFLVLICATVQTLFHFHFATVTG